MRFESASPRTWLLAAAAAWAVIVLLLALFGMGGRIDPLPVDAALVRPLPPVPRAVLRERLAPLAQYGEIASRPLFADDRRPHPFSLQPQGDEQAKAFDYVLTSVLLAPARNAGVTTVGAGLPAAGGAVTTPVEPPTHWYVAWPPTALTSRAEPL